MSQVSEAQNPSDAATVAYPDTGESGETYDIDFRTLPSPRPYRVSRPFFSLTAQSRRLTDSESGKAYEAKVEATHANRDPEDLPVLLSASACDIQLPKVMLYSKD